MEFQRIVFLHRQRAAAAGDRSGGLAGSRGIKPGKVFAKIIGCVSAFVLPEAARRHCVTRPGNPAGDHIA